MIVFLLICIVIRKHLQELKYDYECDFFAIYVKTFIFVTGNPSDQSSLRSSKVQCRGTETNTRDIGVEDVVVW